MGPEESGYGSKRSLRGVKMSLSRYKKLGLKYVWSEKDFG